MQRWVEPVELGLEGAGVPNMVEVVFNGLTMRHLWILFFRVFHHFPLISK